MSSTEKSDIIDLLLVYKERIHLMLDLAFSAALLGDERLAREVLEQEEFIDWMNAMLQQAAFKGRRDIPSALLLARIISANEQIADAATNIARLVIEGYRPPQSIMREVLSSGEEFTVAVRVRPGSKLAEKTVGDLEEELGVTVTAVRRDRRWIYDPPPDFKLRDGDMIIVRGFVESLDDLRRLNESSD